jgi:hypothetical protein
VLFETFSEKVGGVSPHGKIHDPRDKRCFSPHVRTPFDETCELADFARNIPLVSDKMTIDVEANCLN